MNARDMFALVIRILGLTGLAHVLHSVLKDLYYELPGLPGSYYVVKAVYLAAGFYCLRGAPLLVWLAFGCDKSSPPMKPPTD